VHKGLHPEQDEGADGDPDRGTEFFRSEIRTLNQGRNDGSFAGSSYITGDPEREAARVRRQEQTPRYTLPRSNRKSGS
jgi:hypothetical protein